LRQVLQIYDFFCQQHKEKLLVVQTPLTVTFLSGYPRRHVQLILK
jgi:hypothetical protein